MIQIRLHPWRVPFLLSAVLILIGGPMHPGGTMAEMLAHPDWVLGHALVLAGFVSLLAGLLLLRRGGPLPGRTTRWLTLAIVGTALQTVEMILHTAAVVDHANLVAGRATPVLSVHLALAVLLYPVFALTLVGLIVAGARDGTLGSWWIAWIGVAGAAAHGMAPPLVLVVGDERFRVLFMGIAVFALWLALAGLWPVRDTAPAAGAAPPLARRDPALR